MEALFDLPAVHRETFVGQIEYRDEVDSTNTLALALAQQQELSAPLLVLSAAQTGGRGRGENRWWSSRGALTFSLALDGPAHGLPVSSWPQASLVTGLAVCQALRKRVAPADVRVKWPNDVYLEQRKVAGILIETIASRPGIIVVGVGVNVNNSFVDAPAELRESAVALCDVTGQTLDLSRVLASVLQHMEDELKALSIGRHRLRERWSEFCFLTGRRVQVDSVAGITAGVCQGIDDQGALVLETDSGVQRCLAGSVSWQE